MPVLPEKIDPEKVEGEMIKEKIITLVDANPHKAALILKIGCMLMQLKRSSDEAPPAKKAARQQALKVLGIEGKQRHGIRKFI